MARLCERYGRGELELLALILGQHLDDTRGPAVLDEAAAERYADLFVAAHLLVEQAAGLPFLRSTPLWRSLEALQIAATRALPDVQPRIKDDPRYQPKIRPSEEPL